MTDIETLKITDDVRIIMTRYVRYADHKQWNELAGLFTEDGSFTPKTVTGEVLIKMAKKDIASTLAATVGNATAIHHLLHYEVDVKSATTASGVFAMEDWLIKAEEDISAKSSAGNIPGFKSMRGFGYYHADFVKTDGGWRISRLEQTRLKLDFNN